MSNQTNIFDQMGGVDHKGKTRRFSKRELKAIAHVQQKYDYRPGLSRYPKVSFFSRDTGAALELDISEVLYTYDQDLKADSRERERLRREAPARAHSFISSSSK